MSNTILAVAGGVVLTVVLLFAHHNQYLLVGGKALAALLVGFWLINALFVAAIITGVNHRFNDPALSLPQMYWAASVSTGALLISSEVDSALFLLILLTIVFGIFRVTVRQFYIFCGYVVLLLMVVQTGRYYAGHTGQSAASLLMDWLAFSLCAATLTQLCVAIVTMRSRLKRQNLALKEALEAKGRFLANMSHEIRTPMSGVLGMLDIVMRGELTEQQQHYIGVAQSSANGLLTVINDILDFSKMEAGKLRIDPVPFHLVAMVEDVAAIFTAKVEEKGLKFVIDISPATPETICADAVRLRQILINLLANAFKFTEQGEVRLTVAAEPLDDQRVVLSWTVTDTGIGIALDRQEHLFEPFTQADSSTTRIYGGTGLGLAICQHLCRLMDGNITMDSEPGKGSRFRFQIPVQIATQVEHESSPTVPCAEGKVNACDSELFGADGKRSARVLLVEDNVVNQQVAQLLLGKLGVSCETAANGLEAIALLEQAEQQSDGFDMVFMDCQMPLLDGYETTRRIRTDFPKHDLRNVPVIAMTANAMEGDRERCFAAGMDDYLCKPVRIDVLEQVVKKWMPLRVPTER